MKKGPKKKKKRRAPPRTQAFLEPNAKGSASALTNKRILKRCRLRCQQHPVPAGGCLTRLPDAPCLPDGADSSA